METHIEMMTLYVSGRAHAYRVLDPGFTNKTKQKSRKSYTKPHCAVTDNDEINCFLL